MAAGPEAPNVGAAANGAAGVALDAAPSIVCMAAKPAVQGFVAAWLASPENAPKGMPCIHAANGLAPAWAFALPESSLLIVYLLNPEPPRPMRVAATFIIMPYKAFSVLTIARIR